MTVYIGRSLRNNGADDNTWCGTVSNVSGYQWENFTCPLPVLGQFIYIERSNSSMRICEIEVFYGKITHISKVLVFQST